MDHHWFIALRKRKKLNSAFDSEGFQRISSPSGSFFADPFVIKRDNRNYLFFEEFIISQRKGVISCCEIESDGRCSSAVKVIEKEHHISYPFLFHLNEQVFMIPETGANRTIEVYEAIDFPYKWTLAKTIFQGMEAYDSTLWFQDDKWWLFTNVVSAKSHAFCDLHLFYAISPFGPWTEHPQNPIVSDIESARPAGNLFLHNNMLIRPGQNSSVRYGQAISLKHVSCLTDGKYAEKAVFPINPIPVLGNVCCHTYNFNEDFEVVDGAILRLDVQGIWTRAAGYLKRVVK